MEGITKVLWQRYVMIASCKAAAQALATTQMTHGSILLKQTSEIIHKSPRYNDVRRRAGLSL